MQVRGVRVRVQSHRVARTHAEGDRDERRFITPSQECPDHTDHAPVLVLYRRSELHERRVTCCATAVRGQEHHMLCMCCAVGLKGVRSEHVFGRT